MSGPTVTRRQALVTAAAAGVAGIASAPALTLSGQAPGADRLLVAAETEITRLYAGMADTLTDKGANEIGERTWVLDDIIASAVPTSLADCAVKLRRLLDREVGMTAGNSDRDAPALARVLEYIETITGAPSHPTRPVVRSWDDVD